jgi:hypothetical protein
MLLLVLPGILARGRLPFNLLCRTVAQGLAHASICEGKTKGVLGCPAEKGRARVCQRYQHFQNASWRQDPVSAPRLVP